MPARTFDGDPATIGMSLMVGSWHVPEAAFGDSGSTKLTGLSRGPQDTCRTPGPTASGCRRWSRPGSRRLGVSTRLSSPQPVRRVREKSATQPASVVVSPQGPTAFAQARRQFHRSPHATKQAGSVLGPRADGPQWVGLRVRADHLIGPESTTTASGPRGTQHRTPLRVLSALLRGPLRSCESMPRTELVGLGERHVGR
jgi:hypothetical protein